MTRSAGLEKEAHFVGTVDNVDDYFRAADLFVLTSEREGMNNAIFEAMASGVPVLTVPFEGLAAAHGVPGKHYQLSEPNEEALASAMDDLLVPGAAREDAKKHGSEWAIAQADVETVLDRYTDLYSELVDSARARARRGRRSRFRGAPSQGAQPTL
jgi:glycosyltransferase involved in cell wall biosynthesis